MTTTVKFNIGDRVRVVGTCGTQGAKIGQVGTVMESSAAPWIEFDEPTGYTCVILPGIKYSHVDCVSQRNLEIVTEMEA